MARSLFLCHSLFALILPFVSAAPWPRSVEKRGIPSYVTDYAPIVYFHSNEAYFPTDLTVNLANMQPQVDFKPVANAPNPLTLDNLDQLNSLGGANVWLTSTSDITKNPAYLMGTKPVNGVTQNAKTAVVVVNDHGGGLVDVFYFYYHAYNWGGVVSIINQNLGNHVGDWEHNMIRFQNGVPQQVWYSQHSNGQAFTYDTLEKSGKRPIAYSANGSHAVYAIKGPHDHTIPNINLPIKGLITDFTDAGTKWDPVASAYFYSYDASTQAFTPLDDQSPVGYLNFVGRWGDNQYPNSDKRQYKFLGINAAARYVGGPTGPRDKGLNRTKVCPNGKDCLVLPFLIARSLEERELLKRSQGFE